MDRFLMLVSLAIVLSLVSLPPHAAARTVPPASNASAMTHAAQSFLASLGPKQRQRAVLRYDSPSRRAWSFFPGARPGVSMKGLQPKQLQALLALIQTGLSSAGYEKLKRVRTMEAFLHRRLPAPRRSADPTWRDPERYTVTVFGTPVQKGEWGWRVEGHHLSINLSVRNNRIVGAMPMFFGTNVETARLGKARTLRVMPQEADRARQFMALLTPEQRRMASVSGASAQAKLLGATVPNVESLRVGLTLKTLNKVQLKSFMELANGFLDDVPSAVAERLRFHLGRTSTSQVWFTWCASNPMHYRVVTPEFVAEYQNAQGHVHRVLRRTKGDFGTVRQRVISPTR